MHSTKQDLSRKLVFCHDVVHIIRDVCKLVFNLKSNDEIQRVFGFTNEQLEDIIKNIIISLPDNIFALPPQSLEKIKVIFANEFIFFHVQERVDNPDYKQDLSNFIHIFSRDIQKNFKAPSDRGETYG